MRAEQMKSRTRRHGIPTTEDALTPHGALTPNRTLAPYYALSPDSAGTPDSTRTPYCAGAPNSTFAPNCARSPDDILPCDQNHAAVLQGGHRRSGSLARRDLISESECLLNVQKA